MTVFSTLKILNVHQIENSTSSYYKHIERTWLWIHLWTRKCKHVIIYTPAVDMHSLYSDWRSYWNFHQLLRKTYGSKFPRCFASSGRVSDKLGSLGCCAVSDCVVILAYHRPTMISQRWLKAEVQHLLCRASFTSDGNKGKQESAKISLPPLQCGLSWSTQDVMCTSGWILELKSNFHTNISTGYQKTKGIIYVPCF